MVKSGVWLFCCVHTHLNMPNAFCPRGKFMQTTRLTERQIKRLCDEVATTLIDVLNSQNADEKIKVTINDFLTTHNLNNDASELLKRMSWSVKVSLKE